LFRAPTCFNPRPCARGDQHTFGGGADGYVSIHAPVQGATSLTGSDATPLICFNPRPCARGDLRCAALIDE